MIFFLALSSEGPVDVIYFQFWMISFKLINSFPKPFYRPKMENQIYISDTTSIPVTGLLTLENVLLEKSIIISMLK